MTSVEAVPVTDAKLPTLDLTVPEFWQDIHTPIAAAMEESALAGTTDGGTYVLRHAAVDAVLKNPRFVAADLLGMMGMTSGAVWEWWQKVMFSRNPPEHTRLRRLVSKAFTVGSIERLRPWTRSMVEGLLAPAFETGHFDAMMGLGHEVPSRVMARLLGIPDGDREMFSGWTTDIGLAFGAAFDPAVRLQVEAALSNLNDYVLGLLERRRAEPGEDLLSQLLAVEEGGDRLSYDELVALVENLLFAGHDTTRSAIAILVMLFAEHPDRLELVRADRSLVPSAVEEVLRYEAVSFTTSRQAAEDVEVAGYLIPAGMPVALCLPAASRDPRRYDNPDVFNVRRQNVQPPVFGAGIHYCIGAPLARMEMQETLAVLLDRCSALHVEGRPEWTPFAHVRRMETLPASLELL